MDKTITQEVYGRAVSKIEKRDTNTIPAFGEVNADADEGMGYNEEIKALFHELGYLHRNNLVDATPQTESKNIFGKAVKTLVSKLCFFLTAPIVRQQNEINMRTESLLRKMLYQINEMAAENDKLHKELEAMKDGKQGV